MSESSKSREQAYLLGQQRAWQDILQICLINLGREDPAHARAAWVLERTEAIARLRSVCEAYGDNDWPDRLHLADILEKHLWRHMDAAHRQQHEQEAQERQRRLEEYGVDQDHKRPEDRGRRC